MIPDTKSRLIYLTAIWCFAIAIRLSLFTGYMNGDMGNYIQEAYRFSQGNYSIKHFLAHNVLEDLTPSPNFNWQNLRLGVLVPVGFLMCIFGVSETSYAIFTFGCFTLGFCFVYLLGKELVSKSFGLLSALIYSIIPLEINLSTILTAHLPAASLMVLSAYLFLKGWRSVGYNNLLLMCGSGAAQCIAYLMWEGALLLCVVLALYVAVSGVEPIVTSPKLWRSATAFVAGFMPLFLLELLYFYDLSGVLFFRQQFISVMFPKWLELHPVDHANLSWDIYLKATVGSYYYGLFSYAVLGGLVLIAVQYFRSLDSRKQLLSSMSLPTLWLFVVGLYLQFGSSSLSEYQPIFKMHQYLTVVSAPAALVAAYLFFNVPLPHFLRIATLMRVGKQYVPRWSRAALCLCLVMSSVLCAYINYAGNGPYHRDMTFEGRIKQALDSIPRHGAIYTDEWTKNGLDFVFKYSRPIVSYNVGTDMKGGRSLTLSEIKNGYVVVNRIYLNSGHIMKAQIPDYIRHVPREWKLESQVRGQFNTVDIYRIPG